MHELMTCLSVRERGIQKSGLESKTLLCLREWLDKSVRDNDSSNIFL